MTVRKIVCFHGKKLVRKQKQSEFLINDDIKYLFEYMYLFWIKTLIFFAINLVFHQVKVLIHKNPQKRYLILYSTFKAARKARMR